MSRIAPARQRQDVLRNHGFFIGCYHTDGYLAGYGADARSTLAVRMLVQPQAQPAESFAHGGSYPWRILADACREDDAVEAAESAGHRADLECYAIGEQVESLTRRRGIAGEQNADVAADPGKSEEARLIVEHVLNVRQAVAQPPKIEDYARVESATTCRHHEAIEDTEAKGGGDAYTLVERAEAGTGAQMRHDHSAISQ